MAMFGEREKPNQLPPLAIALINDANTKGKHFLL